MLRLLLIFLVLYPLVALAAVVKVSTGVVAAGWEAILDWLVHFTVRQEEKAHREGN